MKTGYSSDSLIINKTFDPDEIFEQEQLQILNEYDKEKLFRNDTNDRHYESKKQVYIDEFKEYGYEFLEIIDSGSQALITKFNRKIDSKIVAVKSFYNEKDVERGHDRLAIKEAAILN